MGFWKTESGICGDPWADIMDEAMHKLAAFKVDKTKTYGEEPHEITMAEFGELVSFCSRGHLEVTVRHPEVDSLRPLSQLHDSEPETYSNSGQMHCPEAVAYPEAGVAESEGIVLLISQQPQSIGVEEIKAAMADDPHYIPMIAVSAH